MGDISALVLGNYSVSVGDAGISKDVVPMATLDGLIQTAYSGGTSCATLLAALPAIYAAPNFYTDGSPVNSTIDLTALVRTIIPAVAPPSNQVFQFRFSSMKFDGTDVVVLGGYDVLIKTDGTVTETLIPFASPLVLAAGYKLNMAWDAVNAAWGQFLYSLPLTPGIVSVSNAQQYLGSIVPACAINTPLPQVKDAIKSANYTKLFNPLGLSLKDI